MAKISYLRALAAVCILLFVPASSHARNQGPTFTFGDSSTQCDDPTLVVMTCDNNANADPGTGALAVRASITSPAGALVPGAGTAYADAFLISSFTTNKAAKAISLTINYHVNSGSASAPSLGLFSSSSFVDAYSTVTERNASGYAEWGGWATIVDTETQPSRSDEDIPLQVIIVDCTGDSIPAATFDVRARFLGGATLEFAAGTAEASVDAVVTSISAQTLRAAPADACTVY